MEESKQPSPKVKTLQPTLRMYYPFALVHYILRDIDPHVRLGLLYDIGCNFEAYFVERNLLSKERAEKRLKIGVAVFHAYAHNWLCQMRYNPRIATGFALTDGEVRSVTGRLFLRSSVSTVKPAGLYVSTTSIILQNLSMKTSCWSSDRFIKTKNLLSAKMILYKFRTMAMSVRRN